MIQPPARHRLLIVDDHPIVRQGLVRLLDEEPDLRVVGHVDNAEDALAFLRGHDVSLVLTDLAMQGLGGLDLIKQVAIEAPGVPVLVLSMLDENFYAERVLRAGARGYVMKHSPTAEVLKAIRQVLRGEIYVSPALSDRMLKQYVGHDESAVPSPVQRLTDRELEVFELIGQGIGTRAIAERLHLSIKTIESYRANIKEKLQLRGASELAQRAVQWVEHMRRRAGGS